MNTNMKTIISVVIVVLIAIVIWRYPYRTMYFEDGAIVSADLEVVEELETMTPETLTIESVMQYQEFKDSHMVSPQVGTPYKLVKKSISKVDPDINLYLETTDNIYFYSTDIMLH
jgi:hypothetical protein